MTIRRDMAIRRDEDDEDFLLIYCAMEQPLNHISVQVCYHSTFVRLIVRLTSMPRSRGKELFCRASDVLVPH